VIRRERPERIHDARRSRRPRSVVALCSCSCEGSSDESGVVPEPNERLRAVLGPEASEGPLAPPNRPRPPVTLPVNRGESPMRVRAKSRPPLRDMATRTKAVPVWLLDAAAEKTPDANLWPIGAILLFGGTMAGLWVVAAHGHVDTEPRPTRPAMAWTAQEAAPFANESANGTDVALKGRQRRHSVGP
jgi:hypothetical protein